MSASLGEVLQKLIVSNIERKELWGSLISSVGIIIGGRCQITLSRRLRFSPGGNEGDRFRPIDWVIQVLPWQRSPEPLHVIR